MITQASPVLHIRFDGRSFDVPLTDLDVGRLSADQDIKRALSDYLSLQPHTLRDHIVDRHDTGNLTIRPQAVFG